mmetsp:Transcript_5161/g.6734  ORF Transcript_5161/g.6734 Transcript_5161/m.6734 type:complete len:99 (-) Transcript_5161:99-395(-)
MFKGNLLVDGAINDLSVVTRPDFIVVVVAAADSLEDNRAAPLVAVCIHLRVAAIAVAVPVPLVVGKVRRTKPVRNRDMMISVVVLQFLFVFNSKVTGS